VKATPKLCKLSREHPARESTITLSNSKKLSATANDRLHAFQAKQQLEAEKAKRRTGDNRKALAVSGGAIVLAILAQLIYFSFGPGSLTATEEPEPEQTNSSEVPSPELAENRIWEGTMEVGEASLKLKLDGEKAPQAVANFISLAQSGFYEGVSCHRLVTEGIFVLQCGDPSGDGTGGPGYNWGPIENAPEADLYTKGYLAMARRGGDAFSMGSQFFIVYADSTIPSDGVGGYSVFGEITGGLKKLNPIIEAGVEGGASDGKPVLETTIGAIELR
jgi:peptidyl-prolyl cis-trans isomerase B (cyclophilin B)